MSTNEQNGTGPHIKALQAARESSDAKNAADPIWNAKVDLLMKIERAAYEAELFIDALHAIDSIEPYAHDLHDQGHSFKKSITDIRACVVRSKAVIGITS